MARECVSICGGGEKKRKRQTGFVVPVQRLLFKMRRRGAGGWGRQEAFFCLNS